MKQLSLNDFVKIEKQYYYFNIKIAEDYIEIKIYLTTDKTKLNLEKLLVRVKNYLYNYKFFHCKRINDYVYVIFFNYGWEVSDLIHNENDSIEFFSINWKHLKLEIKEKLWKAKKIKYQIIEENKNFLL